MAKGHAYSQCPATSTTPVLPVEFLPQSYFRDVLLGDDHMEPREIKLYG